MNKTGLKKYKINGQYHNTVTVVSVENYYKSE